MINRSLDQPTTNAHYEHFIIYIFDPTWTVQVPLYSSLSKEERKKKRGKISTFPVYTTRHQFLSLLCYVYDNL